MVFGPSALDVRNLLKQSPSNFIVAHVVKFEMFDRGENFADPNPAAASIPGDDRQWNDAIGAQTVYLSYHDVATFNIDVQRSYNGGQAYADGFGEAIDPQTFPAAGGLPPTNTANLLGPIRVDRSRCASRGNLYQIFVAPNDVTENGSGGSFRSVYLGVSTDVKLGLSVFTFTDHKIFTGPQGIDQHFHPTAATSTPYGRTT